eukprot:5823384-Pleurochrysis_carterae.AAC.4
MGSQLTCRRTPTLSRLCSSNLSCRGWLAWIGSDTRREVLPEMSTLRRLMFRCQLFVLMPASGSHLPVPNQ